MKTSSEMFAAAGEAGNTQVLVIRQRESGSSAYSTPTLDPSGMFGKSVTRYGRTTRFDVTLHDVC